MSVEPREFGRRPSRNVFGGTLESCSTNPMTGFFRNGCCDTGPEDVGSHTVCIVADRRIPGVLQIPRQRFVDADAGFRLPRTETRETDGASARRAGRRRFEAGSAPRVVLRATHEGALGYCTLADLKRHALDLA